MFKDKPLAAHGLISYRCKTAYGWCMIGAKDDDDALNEAKRSSTRDVPTKEDLQIWDGKEYVPIQ
jgi:trehalose-6-phosphatase